MNSFQHSLAGRMRKLFVGKLCRNGSNKLLKFGEAILGSFVIMVDIPNKVSHQFARNGDSIRILLSIKVLFYFLKEGKFFSYKIIGIVTNLWAGWHVIDKNILIMLILSASIGKQVQGIVNLSLMQVKVEFDKRGLMERLSAFSVRQFNSKG